MKKRRHHSKGNLEISSLSAISHVLENRPEKVQRLILSAGEQTNPRLSKLRQLAEHKNVRVEMGARKKGSEPATAFLAPYVYTELESALEKAAGKNRSYFLALDHVQDPQNFGAICRTAEAFGLEGVVIPKDRGVAVTAGVYQASVGAVETLPIIRIANLGAFFSRVKKLGYWVIGASAGQGAKPLFAMPDFEKAVIVLGAEWEGLSKRLQDSCDCLFEIPLDGQVESLNVSTAGALFVYELWRKGQEGGH